MIERVYVEKWRTTGDFEWRNDAVDLGYNRITLVAVLSPDYRDARKDTR